MAQFRIPEFRLHIYKRNLTTNWYDLVNNPRGGPVINGDVKIEDTRDQKIHAPMVIHCRQRQYQWKFFTGMRPAGFQGWSFGDSFKDGKKAFIIFHTSQDKSVIKLYWFNGFYPSPSVKKFLSNVIPHLIRVPEYD